MYQITLYDFIESKEQLLEKYSKYKIDEYYRTNFKGKYCTFKIIYDSLSSLNDYDEYIKFLYEDLKRYIKPVKEAREEKYWDSNDKVMSFNEKRNSITINCPQEYGYKKTIGEYFCLEMIPKRIFDSEVQS